LSLFFGGYRGTHLKFLSDIHNRIDYWVKSTNFTIGDGHLQIKSRRPLVLACQIDFLKYIILLYIYNLKFSQILETHAIHTYYKNSC